MMADWNIVIALGAAAIAAVALFARMFDKSLSVREHEEFRNAVTRQFKELREDNRRESDRLLDRIKVLEQTRPTTGEIEARLNKPQT
jgi:hypothetical protein